MKRFFAGCALLLSGLLPLSAFALYQPFDSEPFVDLLQAKTAGEGKVRIHIQHHFQNGNIAAMNFRVGYGILDNLDLYAGGLYHANDITYGPEAALIGQHEFEIMPVYSFLNEKKDQPLDVAASLGWNRGSIHFQFVDHTVDVSDTYLSGQVLLSKTIEWAFISAAPVVVYHVDDRKSIVGVMTGVKLMLGNLIALVGEYPVLLNNPYDWKNPWSLGIQFHTGPHTWTLFYSNTQGFTIPNMLQGMDQTFFGFRWSF